MARSKKFTRIPLPAEFTGVPREAISTYCILASYARNSDGVCWPKMETLARTLNCSVRTVQRHLGALREAGMVQFVERRRVRGRFSSYTYQLVHFLKFVTTGHSRPVARRFPNISTKETSFKQGNRTEKREREAKRRREGYEWLLE